ncbi:MAG: D-2-hydroxyacid dehydrogenase [Bauldia sp.]|nr:D-2-hydroxyacid dehydrogenase [Bauldia sp.]
MARIDSVVTNVGFEDGQIAMLRAAFAPAAFVRARSRDDLRTALATADVAVIAGDVDHDLLAAPRLRWVHCDKAGLDGSARPEVFAKGLLVTSSKGRSDAALAEHVLYFMLSLAYDAPALHAAQRRRAWGIAGAERLRALSGQTVGIIGMGHIGSAVAIRCKALGMRVLGYRRRAVEAPPGVDRVYSVDRGEGFGALLAESDFLVLAVPLTDRTHRMLGADEFGRMKRTAFVVNIARGALTDEMALADALQAGRLAGAGLDAFATEPLPKAHPLWRTPRTLITPHVTPRLGDRTERSIAIIAENVRRHRADEPMMNLLTPDEMFSPPDQAPRAPRRTEPLRGIFRRVRRMVRGS